MTQPIVQIKNLSKQYASGHKALHSVTLDIQKGEILALLGPNGAGKTTLISIICGIVNATGGQALVAGHDIAKEYRKSREMVGLVPQELSLGVFEKVKNAVMFSRNLFGKPTDHAYVERLLRDLSLWDKRDSEIRELSGGMKRRVLIAKALSHEPKVLFLDEPTAGVDVELRKDMWKIVSRLRENGVTIILTTHYIEEAEAIADRIGIIQNGTLKLIEEKHSLMKKLGSQQVRFKLKTPISELPQILQKEGIELADEGSIVTYSFTSDESEGALNEIMESLLNAGLHVINVESRATSLEEIFVHLTDTHSTQEKKS